MSAGGKPFKKNLINVISKYMGKLHHVICDLGKHFPNEYMVAVASFRTGQTELSQLWSKRGHA